MGTYDDDDRGRNDREDDRDRGRARSRSPPARATGGDLGGTGQLTGVACRWSDKGFGFIKPDDGSEDVFCHASAIRDGNALREGEKVRFDKSYDERKGKDRADNVTGGVTEEERPRGGGGGGGGFRGEPRPGKSLGTACRWNPSGFGFIKPEDGGEDLFCHFSEIKDGRMLREGDRVEYTKTFDERKGKDRAIDVYGGIQEERPAPYGGGGGGGYGGGGGGYGGGGYGGDRYGGGYGGDRYGGGGGGDRYGGGGGDRYGGGNDRYGGGNDRYGGGNDRYGGGNDRYGGGNDRYGGGSDRYSGGGGGGYGGDRYSNDRRY